MDTRMAPCLGSTLTRLSLLAGIVSCLGLPGCSLRPMSHPVGTDAAIGSPSPDVPGEPGDDVSLDRSMPPGQYSYWVFGNDGGSVENSPLPADDLSDGSFVPWSLVVLPDTQNYAAKYPDLFLQQTRWIAENASALNIRFVVHVGDVTSTNSPSQYALASAAFKILYDADVPFMVVPGNHDYEGAGDSRNSHFSEYILPSSYEHSEEVGFFEPGSTNNSWHIISSGNYKYLFLGLEFGPRAEVVEWAKKVTEAHPDSLTILVTHAFLYYDNTRYDWEAKGDAQRWNPHSYPMAELPGGVNDGQELWEKLVYEDPHAGLVLSGHTLGDGVGHVEEDGRYGNTIHQILANYQTGTSSAFPNGGGGMMRIIQFTHPARASVVTYSPYYDALVVDEQNDFYIRMGTISNEVY